MSGSFVRALVKAWILVNYKLPDNLSGQIQFVRVFFSLKSACFRCVLVIRAVILRRSLSFLFKETVSFEATNGEIATIKL